MAGAPTRAWLEAKAAAIRTVTLQMIAEVGTGHPGSSLSAVELLTCLCYRVMRHRPEAVDWPERDRLILSKGHAAPALYAVLIDLGIVDAAETWRLRQFGSALQGHPDVRFTRGVEVSSGSLGQGLSVGVGLALGLREQRRPSRVFVILGDGECQEGQVWEAALLASQLRLGNLCAIVDYNRIQHDGALSGIVELEPLAAKWRAFGWQVAEIDGHDCDAVVAALASGPVTAPPRLVLAHTVKGRGVDYMENDWHWHSVADAARLARDFRRKEAFDA